MKCKFQRSWRGPCGIETDNESGYCDKHETVKCPCGKQATGECEHTFTQFVCGAPICGPDCKHKHEASIFQ